MSKLPFRHTCSYAYLFETSPAEGVDGFRRFSNFPRPYIINPPLGDKRIFHRYDPLSFEFLLIGRASECLPQVIAAFEAIGQRGIRNGQGRYLIEKVTASGDGEKQKVIYNKGRLQSIEIPLKTVPPKQTDQNIPGVTLTFHTPLLLEERGKSGLIPQVLSAV